MTTLTPHPTGGTMSATEHTAENGLRRIFAWPLRWPLNLFCSHPSTSGLLIEQPDGSWSETDLACLRCGRVVPTNCRSRLLCRLLGHDPCCYLPRVIPPAATKGDA